MNRKITEIRAVIQKLVPLLSGRDLKVTQRGSRAYVETDTRTQRPIRVNIPNITDNASDDLIESVQGFIDHEVGHVLITDFTIYGGGLDAKKLRDPKVQKFVALHNIVEDTMIEKEMIKIFPGSARNISEMRRRFLNKVSQVALDKATDPKERFRYILVPMMRALAGHQEMQEFMDAGNHWANPIAERLLKSLSPGFLAGIKSATSTAETLELTRELETAMEALREPEQESEEEQPPQQKQQQKGQGQGSQSDEQGQSDASSQSEGEQGDEQGEGQSSSSSSSSKGKPGKGGKKKEKADDADRPEADGEDAGADGEQPGDEPGSDDADAGDEADAGDDGDGDAADGAPGDGDDESGDDGDPDDGAGGDEGDEGDGAGADGGEDADVDGDEEGGSSVFIDTEPEDEEDDGQPGGAMEVDDDGNVLVDPENGGERQFEKASDTGSRLNGGVGTMESDNTVFDFTEESFKEADLSNAMANILSREVVEAMEISDYTVFSRDADRIEKLEVPETIMGKDWVRKLDDETRAASGKMRKDIERIMASDAHVIRTPGHRRGKLDPRALYRVPQNDPRVFTQKEEHVSKDTAVTLLVDNSGSMGGAKLRLAMMAAYALSTTLNAVKIAHEVIGFTTGGFGGRAVDQQVQRDLQEEISKGARANEGWYGSGRPNTGRGRGVYYDRTTPLVMPIYKDFDEPVSPAVKARMAFMAFAQNGLNGNIDGESVEIAAERLLKRPERRKVILVLSDGRPAGSTRCEPHLSAVVKGLDKRGVECVGIGIMDDSVNRFYPRHIILRRADELPNEVMKELKRLLTT